MNKISASEARERYKFHAAHPVESYEAIYEGRVGPFGPNELFCVYPRKGEHIGVDFYVQEANGLMLLLGHVQCPTLHLDKLLKGLRDGELCKVEISTSGGVPPSSNA